MIPVSVFGESTEEDYLISNSNDVSAAEEEKNSSKIVTSGKAVIPEKDILSINGSGTPEDIVYSYLRSFFGLNHAAACGILGNIKHESGFNSMIHGDGGTSYGLCQWHNGRYTRLKNYCSSNGLDYSSIEGQMNYFYYELQTFYPAILSYLRSVPDNETGCHDAASYFCINFESPANKYAQGEKRASTALNNYYGKLFSYASNVRDIVKRLIPVIRPAK